MVTLRRTVRLWINPDEAAGPPADQPSYNGFAGRPSPFGLGRFFEIDAACRGEPDTSTGYLINIKDIDRAVRQAAVPILGNAARSAPDADPTGLLAPMLAAVAASLPVECIALTLRTSPYHAFEMAFDAPTIALVRTAFDLAAAHRLNCKSLSPEQNRDVFGKCNNPAGHGHNYRVEPCVAIDLSKAAPESRSSPFGIAALEAITDRVIIERFDHKHLNLDTPEFNDDTGVNPSVENIARVFFDLLAPAIAEASPTATLRSVTVWETDRTSATYPA
ncbi:MAG: 6-carboxytetrahydropterin synthase [Phycisphaerales bacterium]|nr:6-carboxytetrahydropterin synthase [Phycisphaerales bacterium]